MLKPTIEAALSASASVFLFMAAWAWYYVTIGWHWYLSTLSKYPHRQFFTWRFRMTALMLFTIVYFAVLQRFAHR
jgi:hypothetical protein